MRYVLVHLWDSNQADSLHLALIVNDADFLGCRPHNDTELVDYLSDRTFVRRVIQFFNVGTEVASLIQKHPAFHRAHKALEVGWGAVVVDDSDTLEFFLVMSLDFDGFVVVVADERLRPDRHVMRCRDDRFVVLEPDVSDFVRVGHVGLSQLHVLLVEDENLSRLRAYSD